ncbi:hypothetical protein GGR57DRAFT_242862 [Xylariaceae sp. FL1272]|nr:hypothetical protein GGR57DRAFT_242862 [Xylariaceae sp. FL1272]
MEPTPLRASGVKIYETFLRAVEVDAISHASTLKYLQIQKEKFQLWARSLGLFQRGHASLDYRVRDAIAIRQPLFSALQMLQDNLEQVTLIILGERSPFEEQKRQKNVRNKDKEHNDEDEDIDDEAHLNGSDTSSSSSSDNGEPMGEVDYRMRLIDEATNSLYILATKIRSPKNRPQRTLDQIYRHIPSIDRVAHIREREHLETTIVSHVQREQLLELLGDSDDDITQILLSRYCSAENWLIHRAGVANARRRQQFVYWKQHAQRLGGGSGEPSHPPVDHKEYGDKKLFPPISGSVGRQELRIGHATSSVPQQSLATSATQLPPALLIPNDSVSVISHQSRISTVFSPRGDKVTWPPPPVVTKQNNFFSCPYCFVLCPDAYLRPDSWRSHLIHDLQPYHCTYEACEDPNRLYGSRQEWIDHESQHIRVWHCQQHAEEFETQPEYIKHLRNNHEDTQAEHFSPELISTVVGPSAVLQRDCPFCPTSFSTVIEMNKHVAFHLERLAILSLPREGNDQDTDQGSNPSSESHEAQQKGRRRSIDEDFENKGYFVIDADKQTDAYEPGLHDALTHANAQFLQGWATATSSDSTRSLAPTVSRWLVDIADASNSKQDDPRYGFHNTLPRMPLLIETQASPAKTHKDQLPDPRIPLLKKMHIDTDFVYFLDRVQTFAKPSSQAAPYKIIQSPKYPRPIAPDKIAPGGISESELSRAQGYVEYVGWFNDSTGERSMAEDCKRYIDVFDDTQPIYVYEVRGVENTQRRRSSISTYIPRGDDFISTHAEASASRSLQPQGGTEGNTSSTLVSEGNHYVHSTSPPRCSCGRSFGNKFRLRSHIEGSVIQTTIR